MNRGKMNYEVFLDNTGLPPMYGIRCGRQAVVSRVSTDFQEVCRLATLCSEGDLSYLHLKDVVEDFGRT